MVCPERVAVCRKRVLALFLFRFFLIFQPYNTFFTLFLSPLCREKAFPVMRKSPYRTPIKALPRARRASSAAWLSPYENLFLPNLLCTSVLMIVSKNRVFHAGKLFSGK